MKNIQVVDGAENCVYSIFSVDEDDFLLIFPNDQDIEFIDDLYDRIGVEETDRILRKAWNNRVDKKIVRGIHGTLFYELEFKKKYFPTKKSDEAIANPP